MRFTLALCLLGVTYAAIGDACADANDCEAGEVCGDSSECEAEPEDDAPEDTTRISPTGFRCGMDGYVNLVANGMEVALAGLSILRQIGSSFLPHDLRKAVEYAWQGVKGAGSWVGYALAAANFAAEEFDFGEQLCMGMGYLDMGLGYAVMGVELIDTLRDMIPV